MRKLLSLLACALVGITGYSQIGLQTKLVAGTDISLNQVGNTYTISSTASGGVTDAVAPLSIATNTISITQSGVGTDGYLSSADWNTFNNKESVLTFTTPLSRSTNTVTISDAAADGATKGAASFTASDFDAAAGNISIDYTNGQAASGATKGFLTAADWTTFNNKASSSIYTGSGSLVANTTITGGPYTLALTGSLVNTFSVDGSTFSVDASNNRVGIGTAAPDFQLEVVNTNTIATDYNYTPLKLKTNVNGSRMRFAEYNYTVTVGSASAQNSIFSIYDDVNAIYRMHFQAAGPKFYNANNYSYLFLDQTGGPDVSFGPRLTQPFQMYNETSLFPMMCFDANNDLFVGNTWTDATARLQVAGEGTTSATYAGKFDNANNDPILHLLNDRTIGAGTTTPDGWFSIVNPSQAQYGFCMRNSAYSASATAGFRMYQATTGGTVHMEVNANEFFAVNTSGNVGSTSKFSLSANGLTSLSTSVRLLLTAPTDNSTNYSILTSNSNQSRVDFTARGDGNFTFGHNAYSSGLGTSAVAVIGIGEGTAPTTSPTDITQIWSQNAPAGAGTNTLHMRNEVYAGSQIVAGVVYKTDTGDPASGYEGMLVINTFDNTYKVYAEGAFRTITTW